MRAALERFRSIRQRFGLRGKIQIHHILCKEHAHLVDIDINCRQNLMFMPTREGMAKMNLREERLIHDGGHLKYNAYVGALLRELLQNATTPMVAYAAASVLQSELRKRITSDDPTLPWT